MMVTGIRAHILCTGDLAVVTLTHVTLVYHRLAMAYSLVVVGT